MKKTPRILTVLLAFMMLTQVFCISAFADYFGEGFGVAWDVPAYDGSSLTVSVTLYDLYTGENPDQLLYQMYEPVLVITDASGKEISHTKITGPLTSVTLSSPGTYTAAVYDYAGNMQGGFEDAGDTVEYRGLPLTITEDMWSSGTIFEDDLDSLYDYGYRFWANFSENGKAVTVTLSALREEDASRLSALIREVKPAVNLIYYQDGEIIDGDMLAFSSNTMTVDYSAYDGIELWICAPTGTDEYESCALIEQTEDDAAISGEAIYTAGEVPSYEPIQFDDVDYDAWYGETVEMATLMGLMNGTSEGQFSPNANMTYSEAITLAARMHAFYWGEEIPETSSGPWYQMYVDYAKANGIPYDYDYTANITREDYIHIFYAALPQEEYAAINTVRDGAISDLLAEHLYASEIYTFYRAGILTGSDAQGSFQPKNSIMRCEVAAIVCRMIDSSYRQSFTLG